MLNQTAGGLPDVLVLRYLLAGKGTTKQWTMQADRLLPYQKAREKEATRWSESNQTADGLPSPHDIAVLGIVLAGKGTNE